MVLKILCYSNRGPDYQKWPSMLECAIFGVYRFKVVEVHQMIIGHDPELGHTDLLQEGFTDVIMTEENATVAS